MENSKKKYKFGKKYRIHKKKEFLYIIRKGRRFIKDHIKGYCARNNFSYYRLGVSVNKKFGKAVERNRFKRLVKESFRTYDTRFKKGIDIIILPIKGKKCLEWEIINKEVREIMDQALTKRLPFIDFSKKIEEK